MNQPIEPKKLSEEKLNQLKEQCDDQFVSSMQGKKFFAYISALEQHIAAQDNELETAINRYETEAMKAGRLEEQLTTALATIGVMREALKNLCGISKPAREDWINDDGYNHAIVVYDAAISALTQSPPEAMELVRDKERLDWFSAGLIELRWHRVCNASRENMTLRQAIDTAMKKGQANV